MLFSPLLLFSYCQECFSGVNASALQYQWPQHCLTSSTLKSLYIRGIDVLWPSNCNFEEAEQGYSILIFIDAVWIECFGF